MALDLRSFTPARVALGRTGHSLPTAELLRFRLDHARARDAVYQELDPPSLGLPHLLLRSAAPDRATYLRRPDLGRKLSSRIAHRTGRLRRGHRDRGRIVGAGRPPPCRALLAELTPLLADWRLAPLTVVLQGRVAIGDEIGQRLGARQVVVLIGERPGLTSPDSLGIYLTWDPRPGRTDAERNCISNVRTEGLPYSAAARTLHFLMSEARVRKLTGVGLSTPRLL